MHNTVTLAKLASILDINPQDLLRGIAANVQRPLPVAERTDDGLIIELAAMGHRRRNQYPVPVEKMAAAMAVPVVKLERVLNGEDFALTGPALAGYLRISSEEFRGLNVPVFFNGPKFPLYLVADAVDLRIRANRKRRQGE